VPASHGDEQKLPAVSGSSGRLLVEPLAEAGEQRSWPGQVFADSSRDYTQAMLDYVAASQSSLSPVGQRGETPAENSLKAQKRALHQEEAQLRDARRATRQQRRQEDRAWQALRLQRQAQPAAPAAASPAQRQAQEQQWRALRQQRQESIARRHQEDEAWRQQRLSLRQRWSALPIVTAWIAILIITDNCTRQCLGLPLFVAGPKVTAELIVAALRVLLPPELLFLITDRGTHFKATAFRELLREEEFIHVLIARHRPQSNGIAERLVRTLKEWLMTKSWDDDQELAAWLALFLVEYNDRPHQGLPIPGLSPNEFANRIWLM
jgi:transposase InsO family protein